MYLSYFRKANALKDVAPNPLQSRYFQEKESRPRVFCMTEELFCRLSASFLAPEIFRFLLNNLTTSAGVVMPPSLPTCPVCPHKCSSLASLSYPQKKSDRFELRLRETDPDLEPEAIRMKRKASLLQKVREILLSFLRNRGVWLLLGLGSGLQQEPWFFLAWQPEKRDFWGHPCILCKVRAYIYLHTYAIYMRTHKSVPSFHLLNPSLKK